VNAISWTDPESPETQNVSKLYREGSSVFDHDPIIKNNKNALLKQMILHAIVEGLVIVDRTRQALLKFIIGEPTSEASAFPSAKALLSMAPDKQEQWIRQAFEAAAQEDFEVFEVFEVFDEDDI
jgi:hypothetical protein